MVSKSNALHFAGVGLRDETSETTKDSNTFPAVFVKFTEFAGNKEIETETDEGHTGRRTLNLGENRSKASASPEITDNLRLNQGLEDLIYYTLGNMTETTVTGDTSTETTYKQEMTPNVNGDLPVAHILHGFNDNVQGCRIYKNAVANETTFTMNSEEKPTIQTSFVSDYPYYGDNSSVVSPTFGAYLPKALKAGALSVYFKPYIDGAVVAIDEAADKIDCLTESEVSINNNIEASTCAGTEFGESNKDIKNLEVTGSMTLRYVDKDIERLFSTGHYTGDNSHKVSENSLYGALRFKYQTSYVNEGKTVPLLFQIDIPNACISNAESSESGDDVKTISMEITASEELGTVGNDIIKITTQSALQFKTGDNVTKHICQEMPA